MYKVGDSVFLLSLLWNLTWKFQCHDVKYLNFQIDLEELEALAISAWCEFQLCGSLYHLNSRSSLMPCKEFDSEKQKVAEGSLGIKLKESIQRNHRGWIIWVCNVNWQVNHLGRLQRHHSSMWGDTVTANHQRRLLRHWCSTFFAQCSSSSAPQKSENWELEI